MNHVSVASVVVVALIWIPVPATGQSLAAVHAIRSTSAVVAATDQAAAAVAVPVAVSLTFTARVGGGAARPVVIIGMAIYNGGTELCFLFVVITYVLLCGCSQQSSPEDPPLQLLLPHTRLPLQSLSLSQSPSPSLHGWEEEQQDQLLE